MLLADMSGLEIPIPQLLLAAGIGVALILVVSGLFVFSTKRQQPKPARHWLSRLLYAAYLLAILVLAVSSFGSIVQFGHMSGYALLAHISAAGAFVFLMVAVAILYLPYEDAPTDRWWATRWSAWLLIASSIGAAGTMLFSMLPVLDTESMLQVATLHRYAGLTVVVAAVLHLYTSCLVRLGYR